MDNLEAAENSLITLNRGLEEYNAARAKIEADQRLTPQGKAEALRALDENKLARLNELRNNALEFVRAEQTALSAEEQRLNGGTQFMPTDLAQWQEAAARSVFVREDVTANPAEAVDLFRSAVQSGDRIAAWLLMRYGRAAADNVPLRHKWDDIVKEVIEPGRRAQIKERITKAAKLQQKIPLLRSDRASTITL